VRSESRKAISFTIESVAGRLKGLMENPRWILVDRSAWIDFLSSSPGRAGAELRRRIADAEPFAIALVIVAEVLQGLTCFHPALSR
jgi:hypothetical protein